MKGFYIALYILTFCLCSVYAGHSADASKCTFVNNPKNDDSEKIMNVISSLIGKNFVTEKDGYNYIVSICNDISEKHELGTVIRSRTKEDIIILGRRNDTHLAYGDSWIMLTYGSGDFKVDNKCLVQRRASLYVVCDPEAHGEEVQLADEDGWNYKFILPTSIVCNYNEKMSGMKIFLIIVTVSLTLYCLIGIAYRRIVDNAQRCQHIPHFKFWSRIGNSLADGCNYVCRCDSEPEDSWNNITSNFESGDRDDALLRP